MSRTLGSRLTRLEASRGSDRGRGFRAHRIVYRQGDDVAKEAAFAALRQSGTFDEQRDLVFRRVIISPVDRGAQCGRSA